MVRRWKSSRDLVAGTGANRKTLFAWGASKEAVQRSRRPGQPRLLMGRLARRIADKRLLRIVRRMLEAGIMKDGVVIERYEGTPQGGPLSPLLANLLLDEVDKELERRDHRFCRYADDLNIYVRSKAAGDRVMPSVACFMEKRLRLLVNRTKSAVAHVSERKFLGYRLLAGGRLIIAPESLKRGKDRIREITRQTEV
jgi:RNA-directed DNA polymerase